MGIKFYQAGNVLRSKKSLVFASRILPILIFLIAGSLSGLSQTPLSFTALSGDFAAPDRGSEQWNGSPWDNSNDPYIPAGNAVPLNIYRRFLWAADLEDATQGSYNWAVFDGAINAAIDKGQIFSFGLMPMCTGCINRAWTYPTYLHNLMQSEPTNSKDWVYDGVWIPNWNSPNYLARWAALCNAVAAHIQTGSHAGKNYRDVIGYVDIRGFGETGEWNVWPWYNQEPTGRQATDASLRTIVDAVANAFPNNQLVICFGALDPGNASLVNPATSTYILNKSNAYGRIGWRRDNLGNAGFDGAFDNNTNMMNQWRVAPIGGEPNNDANDAPYGDLPREVTKFHISSFGNGNWSSVNASNATFVANARAAGANAGYRLALTGGSMTTTLSANGPFNVTVNWQNTGNAPPYRSWNITYELRRTDGTVVWTGVSGFNLKLFLPQGSPTPATDNFTLSAVAAGTYNLYMIIKDPVNYRKPLPLAITGRGADGSYLLRSNITVGSGGPVNQPPSANAGGDKIIQLPTATVSLTGTGADVDGTVASYAWTKLSGPAGGVITTPAAAGTTITGLVQGVYVYTLTVTDNQGSTASDNVQITVNAAALPNVPPVANASSDKTIQLPTNNVSMAGSGTDADGSVATYAWTKLSGPASGTITSPGTGSTTITGLGQGVYVYTLTVTDNVGATASDNVQVTVNPAAVPNTPPVASAGSDKTIQLPTNTVSLIGTAIDLDGIVSSIVWAKLSGPAGGSITTPAAVTTGITGLTQGVYFFTLTVTDDDGSTDKDTVQVTVNAAPNQPPVANAGADLNITLPTSSATINGGASSDADGSITTFLWTKISGPSQFAIGNTAAASTIVNNLTAGVYSFQLRVTDNAGAIALDTIKIIVNAAPVNQPPVSNAGADISITLPTNIANLNGSASSDVDGSVTAYAWTQVSGPNTATFGSATTATTSVSGLQQGTYLFSLRVTDNGGTTDLDSVLVTVNAAPNVPPVANAGNSKTITLPTNSTGLDGSLSSDADGSITSYGWAQISGPSTANITGQTLAVANAGSLVAGVYTFELTVTDNRGATAKANVKITVAAAGLQPPIANAGADRTITLPTNSVVISGSASTAPSGTIVSYNWTERSGPSVVALSNTVQNTLNNLQAGVYIFYLTVTDNNAATGTDSVIVTVNPAANQAPVANAGASINLTLPINSTSLNGSGSTDPDGTISNYSWTRVSGPSTPTITGANTATANISGLIVGNYTYQLTVTDNSGASSSAQVIVRVSAAVNLPPVANAGVNQAITSPANSINLNGSASADPDGTIVSYTWVTISGPGSITISNSNTATPNVVGLQTGAYLFELTVTDNRGASAKDQVAVTVLPSIILPNQPPVSNAGTSNFTITLPVSSVILDGSSSFDADGTIAAYSWRNTSGPSAAVMTGTNTVSPTVSQLLFAGTYIFELTVTDNNGAKDIDYVNVVVNPAVPKVNVPPVANAGNNNISITAPASTATLDGTNSYDPDGVIATYSWRNTSGPTTAVLSRANTASPTASQLQVGTYVFELTVTDNNGASNKDYVNVTVFPEVAIPNLPPVAYAGEDDSIRLPASSYMLDATPSLDPDGTIASYQWSQVSGPNTASSATMSGAQVSVSNLAAGQYEFEVRVSDNDGATSTARKKLTVEQNSSFIPSTDRLIIFPNPAHSTINGRIISPITGTVKISVFDMNGRLVYTAEEEKTSEILFKTMRIDALPSGMYTVVINLANRKTMVSKFIKN